MHRHLAATIISLATVTAAIVGPTPSARAIPADLGGASVTRQTPGIDEVVEDRKQRSVQYWLQHAAELTVTPPRR